MITLEDAYSAVEKRLSTVSPTFCLAKWLQVTTTLYNGMTHSCHHPGQHKIDPESLKSNPTALHNTPIKIHARKDLLNGVQTPECGYCWKAESVKTPGVFSDRVTKSMERWASKHFDRVVDSGLGESISPTYMEVAFENTCNLMCAYCLPEVSSKVMHDAKVNGPVKLPSGRKVYDLDGGSIKRIESYDRGDNPFIDAFWENWPTLRTELEVFRITGGEPLLSKHAFRAMNDLIDNPNPRLEFGINSNLCVPDQTIDAFLELLPRLAASVESVKIFTSAEAVGAEQEYARYGMDWAKFASNLERVCKFISSMNNVTLVVMTTVGVFAMNSFGDLLAHVTALRDRYGMGRLDKISTSINFLMHPQCLRLTVLPDHVKTRVIAGWNRSTENVKLNHTEKMQFERLCKFVMSPSQAPTDIADLRALVTALDARRSTDFVSTFGDNARCILTA